MTREIKFRAWDLANNTMVEEPYKFYKLPHEHPFVKEYGATYMYYETWLDIDDGIDRPCHILQYTELKDKHGVEIYEGDILKYSDAEIAHYIIKWSNEAARWHDTRIEDGDSQTDYDGFDFVRDCVVIGNIYQNPELLNR